MIGEQTEKVVKKLLVLPKFIPSNEPEKEKLHKFAFSWNWKVISVPKLNWVILESEVDRKLLVNCYVYIHKDFIATSGLLPV